MNIKEQEIKTKIKRKRRNKLAKKIIAKKQEWKEVENERKQY